MAVGVDNCKAELLVKSLNLVIQCINHYGRASSLASRSF